MEAAHQADRGNAVVGGTDVNINVAPIAKYRAGRTALPVKHVGRLLLRCVARRGLVSGSQCLRAEAGADIVSLDQHSTQQTGGTFMPRTTFHRPGSAGARDELEFIQTLPTRYATWGEFIHVPAQREIREEAERRQLHLLRGNVDLWISANRDTAFPRTRWTAS